MIGAPFGYFGGKTMYLPVILPRIPKHKTYVEPFGGSASVLLNKTPSEMEVYNDVDGDLCNFFRVLRDPEKASMMQELLYLTPFSREEYMKAREDMKSGIGSDVERARQWFIMCRQSFSATPGTGGWRVKNPGAPGSWKAAVDRLEPFTRRLMKVQIENLSFAEVFKLYDSENTLFYVDPPYTLEQRSGGKVYRNEIQAFDHTLLMGCITKCKGMVILSGYHNPKYEMWLKDWQVVDIKTFAPSASKKNGTKEQQERTEVLWIKPNAVKDLGLWGQFPGEVTEVLSPALDLV